jgi:hypothetical protein
LLAGLGLSPGWSSVALAAACGVDLLLGIATVAALGARLWLAQLAVMECYTAALSWVAPWLWLDPFGALVKNLPIAAVLLGLLAAEREP